MVVVLQGRAVLLGEGTSTGLHALPLEQMPGVRDSVGNPSPLYRNCKLRITEPEQDILLT